MVIERARSYKRRGMEGGRKREEGERKRERRREGEREGERGREHLSQNLLQLPEKNK